MNLLLSCLTCCSEYAAKMRSVDVVKCWPFSGGTDEIVNKEDIDRLLPPITVTKFRWWSHELDLLRSSNNSNSSSVVNAEAEEDNKLVEEEEEEEEKLDMVCPVCRVFTAATVNALNAHIDNCLVQASREERRRMRLAIKAKSRPPKKRSIVEIFAESRQIDKLDVNDDNLHKVDGQQHELDCTDVEFNSKIVKKKKKKMKKVKILNKLMHNKKKLKNKSLKNKLITNNKVCDLGITLYIVVFFDFAIEVDFGDRKFRCRMIMMIHYFMSFIECLYIF